MMIATTFNNKVIESGMNYFSFENYNYLPEDEIEFISFYIGKCGPGEVLHQLGAIEHWGGDAID